jgi:hypothetical protein
MIQMQLWLANLKDTLWKIAGTFLSFLFFGVGSLYTTLSLLNNLVAVILIILAIITIVSLFSLGLIYIVPWLGIPSYITWSITYLTVSVPLIVVAIFGAVINDAAKQQQCDADPNCCFHCDTIVKTESGLIKMSDIDKMISACQEEMDEGDKYEGKEDERSKQFQYYADYFIEKTVCLIQKLITKND